MEWPAQLNPSSWILSHLQETAKNTLPSLFDPLTLALSILIYLSFYLKNKQTKKNTHLTLYQLHIYSLTASLSWKINTSFLFSILSTCFLKKNKFLFSIFYLLVFLKKKKTCYVYCIRVTKTCHSTCMLLLFCWFWLRLLSSFVSRFG